MNMFNAYIIKQKAFKISINQFNFGTIDNTSKSKLCMNCKAFLFLIAMKVAINILRLQITRQLGVLLILIL